MVAFVMDQSTNGGCGSRSATRGDCESSCGQDMQGPVCSAKHIRRRGRWCRDRKGVRTLCLAHQVSLWSAVRRTAPKAPSLRFGFGFRPCAFRRFDDSTATKKGSERFIVAGPCFIRFAWVFSAAAAGADGQVQLQFPTEIPDPTCGAIRQDVPVNKIVLTPFIFPDRADQLPRRGHPAIRMPAAEKNFFHGQLPNQISSPPIFREYSTFRQMFL